MGETSIYGSSEICCLVHLHLKVQWIIIVYFIILKAPPWSKPICSSHALYLSFIYVELSTYKRLLHQTFSYKMLNVRLVFLWEQLHHRSSVCKGYIWVLLVDREKGGKLKIKELEKKEDVRALAAVGNEKRQKPKPDTRRAIPSCLESDVLPMGNNCSIFPPSFLTDTYMDPPNPCHNRNRKNALFVLSLSKSPQDRTGKENVWASNCLFPFIITLLDKPAPVCFFPSNVLTCQNTSFWSYRLILRVQNKAKVIINL